MGASRPGGRLAMAEQMYGERHKHQAIAVTLQVFSTDNAFAALKADGSIKAWGEAGGSGAPSDSGYTQVFLN